MLWKAIFEMAHDADAWEDGPGMHATHVAGMLCAKPLHKGVPS